MQFTWELIQYARYHTAVSSPRRTAPSPIRSLEREAARRAESAMTGIPITMNSTRLTTKKALILLNTFWVNTPCTLLSSSCIAWCLHSHPSHDAGRGDGPSPHFQAPGHNSSSFPTRFSRRAVVRQLYCGIKIDPSQDKLNHPPLFTEAPGVGRHSRKPGPWAARTSPCTVRTDDAPKVRFSATVGEEPDAKVRL